MIFTPDEWEKFSAYLELEYERLSKYFPELIPQSKLGDYLCEKVCIIDMSNEEMDDFIKEYIEKKKKNNTEPKRLFKICFYNSNKGRFSYSKIRDLTDSEALKWYDECTFSDKFRLLYKKDGEWVEYEKDN